MKPSVLKQTGTRATVLVVALLLGACAKINEGGLWLATSKVDAFLLVNGQLLTGDARLVPDRTGRMAFTTDTGAVRSCGGAMRYTASRSGEMDVQCNDGTQVTLEFTTLSETKGYGYGTTSQGIASVAYGFSESDALAFLKAPPGKKLVLGADGALTLQ
jgi:hypothetical protein